MELLWFGDGGRPLLFFPTSMGRFYQNEDFGLIGALKDKIEAGFIQVVCVDSVDTESWYNRGIPPALRARRHEDYDRYLAREVLPAIVERTGDRNVAVFGASFGAFHAASFATRHPDLVTKAILFSGLYSVHMFVDPYWDEACHYASPASSIPSMDERALQDLRHIEWVVATGEQDSLARENREFAGILGAKSLNVHHELWPGVSGHDWPFWNRYIRNFI
jgi:esterase/lipase superfamily enzyme